jgi:type IV secretory pathway VirB4 component
MESSEADDISARLEKYIIGSFRGIFDQKSNFDIKNQLVVFSVKEMEESIRPVAMYVILDFIWTKVKKDIKKRILVVDEAWYFMKSKDSASFLHSMVKRARKYFLGVTTITQDVEDFLHNDYGRAIVTNASIQFLMKQSTASVPILAETFYLSQGERQLLVSSDVGEGIFFAGQNHVALRVVASDEEHELITTNPEELAARKSGVSNMPGADSVLRQEKSPDFNNKQEDEEKKKKEEILQQFEKVDLKEGGASTNGVGDGVGSGVGDSSISGSSLSSGSSSIPAPQKMKTATDMYSIDTYEPPKN